MKGPEGDHLMSLVDGLRTDRFQQREAEVTEQEKMELAQTLLSNGTSQEEAAFLTDLPLKLIKHIYEGMTVTE